MDAGNTRRNGEGERNRTKDVETWVEGVTLSERSQAERETP